ncbi:MAG: hypothetical protein UT08_C0009G0034 [Candidatus Woesebacteria bacterium GW2011_GWB1_38_8]|uniref:Uncharacterized protein n=1 Tax=Candidatus Woesebacteria bacterium GW2011_GWB1_38_8 TaxID=1618570 RepID=A0A0G0LBH6_9BACT|nr:MAG: hypothetical protein UT08_C0009G0034 [Candidatus Woesebacteria bacterium GW2011_GWB1_38_8]KKS77771.1 MAG: hypothetical protein UV51_C0005G0181 [Candidatus Woesebacteria bacterium GW2011_GWC1_42_9]
MKKVFLFLFLEISFTGLLVFAGKTLASEGTIELESVTGAPYRCFAASIRMQNLEYRIPMTCINLIYPADENIFNYILWATPSAGGNPLKLGALGLGRGEYKTKTSFSSLFVTTESNKDTKTPSGRVVMRGDIDEITFLKEATTPTPETEAGEEITAGEEEGQIEEAPTQELTTRQKLGIALRRAGIAALFALVALIGLIFVITRSRG